MKTVSILLVAILIVATSLFAEAKTKTESPQQQLRSQVITLLDNPNIALEEDLATSEISLMVNNKGQIVVIDVDTNNETVASYVKSRLNYKKALLGEHLSGKMFSIVYKIKKA
ncbi:MAG: hypothetical protein WBG71_12810 [Leeuwenhoekiella sp.]